MKPLLCIVGPTASGKSALALALAQKLNGEIVSCDSMQIYRGCDIVTAKASLEEQRLIPHHLLDIVNPNESFSAASWAHQANRIIEDIEARGHTPIVCGGTGFYLRALLEPQTLAVAPPDAGLRASLERDWEQLGVAKMHERLAQLNPGAAARLHPNDRHRVLRALEVELSPPAKSVVSWPARPAQIFCLDWPRELLVERIGARTKAMIEAGALDETRGLVERWGEDAPALGSVGYKQLRAHLKSEVASEAAVELWRTATRQYAKRQMTWFRGQTEAVWLDGRRGEELVEEVVLEHDQEVAWGSGLN